MAKKHRAPRRQTTSTQAPRPEAAAKTSRGLTLTLAAVLVLATVWAYAPSFCGVLLLDDVRAIARNRSITTLWPLSAPLSPPAASTVAGRPIANLSFAVNYAVAPPGSRDAFGLADRGARPESRAAFLRNVWGYHLGNLLIHILAGLTLLGVVRRTLVAPRFGGRFGASSVWLAFAVALVWLLHPLQTSAVTYLAQRVESLMGCFLLLTLYAAIRSLEDAGRSRAWAACAVVTCGLAMGTKEVAVVTPLVVALWDWSFAGAERPRVRWGLAAALAATWIVLVTLLASEHRGPSIDLAPSTVWSYLLTQAAVVTHYLRLAFVPSPLVFLYTWPLETSLAAVAGPVVLLAALLGASLSAARWRHPAGFAGVSFFLILAPTSSVLPIVTEVAAEHRMYLPLAALISLVAIGGWWAAREAASRWPAGTGTRQPSAARHGVAAAVLLLAAAVLLLAAASCAVATRARNEDYQSEARIWRDTVDTQPGNARARIAYGQALTVDGRYAEAEIQLRRAADLDPRDPVAQTRLGSVVAAQGRLGEAIPWWISALRLWPADPDARRFLAQAAAEARAQGNEALAAEIEQRARQLQAP